MTGPRNQLPPGEELVALYDRGANMYDLARRFGVSAATVHRHLHLWGVEVRPVGRRRKLDTKAARAVALHRRGLSWREVGAELGMSGAGAHNLAKRYGLLA